MEFANFERILIRTQELLPTLSCRAQFNSPSDFSPLSGTVCLLHQTEW